MSQSATWDTLQVARDARLEGRLDVEAELMREVNEDLPAYSHLYCRTTLEKSMPDWSRRQQHRMLEWVGTPAAASRHYPRLGPLQYQRAPLSTSDEYRVRLSLYANPIVYQPLGIIGDV